MIQRFVDRFMSCEALVRQALRDLPEYCEYTDLVRIAITHCANPDGYREPDPKRIHCIDDGDYQGTLLYCIGANNYQPDTYWYVMVSYGSCSGCDSLQAAFDMPDEQRHAALWQLTVNIIQGLKVMEDGYA